MRRLLFLALTAIIGVLPLCADPTLVFRNDPLYEQVRRIALHAGTNPPPQVSPITQAELMLVLKRIDPEELSPRVRQDYMDAIEWLSASSPGVPYGTVGLGATAEFYAHTAEQPDEWIHWYPDRRDMISIPLRAWPAEGISIEFDLDWRKNYPLYPGRETINPDPFSNIPMDLLETDMQFPFHALLSVGGDRWGVQFGRTRLSMGFGEQGSMILSDHVEFHEFLLASVFGHKFSYRTLYLDLEPWRPSGAPADERFIFGHRIEMRALPWLSLAANEVFVYADRSLELRYLNPLMIMHSWFMTDYGSDLVSFEFLVHPAGGLELYGHFTISQLQSAIEIERGYGDTEPNAFGYLAGARYQFPTNFGWLSAGTEWAFTDPWLYLGRGGNPLTTFSYVRRVQAENAIPATKVLITKSLGYPAGPDYYGIIGYADADLDSGWSLRAEVEYGMQGENDITRFLPADDLEDAQRETPSGDAPERILRGRLEADTTVARFSVGGVPVVVNLGGILDIVRVSNNDHVVGETFRDVQFSPYVSLETDFVVR